MRRAWKRNAAYAAITNAVKTAKRGFITGRLPRFSHAQLSDIAEAAVMLCNHAAAYEHPGNLDLRLTIPVDLGDIALGHEAFVGAARARLVDGFNEVSA